MTSSDPVLEYLRSHLSQPVVLIGMMGAGKTHLGRKLAEALKMEFKDSDKIVEEKAGLSINEIFTQYGEEKFRAAEQNAVLEILSQGACVLATGGGAIMNEHVRTAFKDKAITVWLNTDIQEILKRVRHAKDRPLLKQGDPETVLKNLLKKRENFYREADIEIKPTGNAEETLKNMINSLYEYLKADTV